MAILRAENIGLMLSSRHILQDISLELSGGDRLLLLGASGSGKSSLLQLLNRLQSPTDGSLTFAEKAYASYAPEILRRQIALIPQEAKLLGMTVKDALFYPLVLQKIPRAERQRRWLLWQDKLDIPDDWLDRNEALLSGGQKQWVAIARTLLMEPQVLLLDEPTSALDLGRTQKLAELLLHYQAQQNIPLAIATHNLEFAQQLATHVIYIEQGQVKIQAPNHQIDWMALRAALQNHHHHNNADSW